MKILFLHGWQSIPGGVKPTDLAEHGHTIINPKLPDDDFAAALAIAQAEFDKHKPEVVVGSSRGGALAMNLKMDDTPLVLLCPAWKKYGTATTIRANTTILHSRADDVIPFADSVELVSKSGLPKWSLVETGSDHRLADPKSLEVMLEACLIGGAEPHDRLRRLG
jgi:alpha-beta hydrolase superfamily lysophospholipase